MAEVQPPMSSPSRKRPREDEDATGGTHKTSPNSTSSLSTPLTVPSLNDSPSKATNSVARATSPSLSSHTSSSGDPNGVPSNAAPGAVPQKRRKLTFAEKEKQRQEKETKTKERAEVKAKRDEEKRIEEEEKQRKRAEREEKKKQKEFEAQQKQQEKERAKQKEEDEKQKKERSQLRLNAFFMAPPKASSPLPKSPTKDDADDPTVADQDTADPVLRASTSPQKKPQSDYHRFFLPFSLPTNASMAQLDVYSRTEEELQMIQDRLDSLQPVAEHDSPSTLLLDWMDTFKNSYAVAQTASKFIPDIAVKEIIIRLHGSSGNPIDLTEKELAFVNETPFEMLKSVPMKYIHFEQDVRPPYFGTYTRPMPGGNARRLSRNPFARALREADYDYDSEAEWEEPEEGEDIGSDGEEDGESNEGEDDMEGFLDDEDDVQRAKRAMVTKELEPDCSGLCWQDNKGIMRCADGSDAQNSFQGYSLGILLDPAPVTIDPYSTAYWQEPPKQTIQSTAQTPGQSDTLGLMQPPSRFPLQAKPNGGNSRAMEDFTGAFKATTTTLKPAKRMIPPEQLGEFRREVQGSDLTKIALVEALKKKFPSLPKDAINNTLAAVASRVGSKEKDKKWMLNSVP